MPFPAVLLFLDYWPLKRMEGLKVSTGDGRRRLYRLVFEKIPLFAIVCGFAALDFVTQRRIGALGSSEAHPFASRLANAAASYLMYIWRAFWPTHLAACYPYPAFSWWKIAGALTLLAALTTAAVLGRKRFPYVFTGWFWYALVLTPVSGLIVQVGNAPRADRYAYVSTIGLFVASAWGLGAVARRWRRTAVAIPVSVVAALGMYAMVANVQVRHWSDSVTLFRHALDVTADNYLACEFLGKTLADQGHDEDAIAAFNDSLRIAPGFADAHNNLGNVLLRNRRYPEAVSHFTEALRTSPRDAIILYNMGLALFSQSKDDDAILYFRKAIAAKPDFPLAHNNLGYALARKGAIEEAVAEYREALRIEPTSSLALYNLGDALRAQGHCQEAIPYYTRAAEADPQKRHEALNRIGETLVRQGKSDEAIACFRQAIAAKPDFTPAHNNLGQELARKGSFADAIAEYREVLKIAPQNATALNGLRAAGNAMQNPRR
jgi:tetratricopeptide (TPR) repeat protein